jgi:hypothetical protein
VCLCDCMCVCVCASQLIGSAFAGHVNVYAIHDAYMLYIHTHACTSYNICYTRRVYVVHTYACVCMCVQHIRVVYSICCMAYIYVYIYTHMCYMLYSVHRYMLYTHMHGGAGKLSNRGRGGGGRRGAGGGDVLVKSAGVRWPRCLAAGFFLGAGRGGRGGRVVEWGREKETEKESVGVGRS